MQMGDDEIGIMRLPVERHHRHHDASESSHDEGHKPAHDEQRRCVEARFSYCQSGDPGKYLDTGRNTHGHACRGKEAKDRKSTVRTPVTNAHLVCRLQLEKKKKHINM